jgi:outer membrane lipase/esterase
MIAFVAMSGAMVLPAEAQFSRFSRLTDFGDSYADTGFAPGGILRFPPGNFACPNGPAIFPTCRFTGGTNFVDSLQSIFGLPLATNFAFGGALTDTTNTLSSSGFPELGFVQELANLAASGRRFTDHDLIALSIGGNDSTLALSTDSIAQLDARATTVATNAVAGVQQLVAAGARNVAWLSPGNSFYFPAPNGEPLTFAQHTAWADTFYQQTQQLLAPMARSGVRIFLFDFGTLQARVAANPGQYGFASASGCQAVLGVAPCLASSSATQNSFFYFNDVHPTSAAMALIASYMANQIDAPLTVVPQGSITTSIATNFATSVLDRLDAYRTFQAAGIGPATARAMSDAVPALGPAAIESPWSIYADVNYASGSLDRQFLSAGYDGEAVGGTFGIEYRVDPRLRLGGVFGYAAPDIKLDVQNGHDHINSYQLAGYGSFTDTNWFADALVAYGRHDFALDRQGVIDTVHASASANAFTTAGKAGYLVDIGPVRVGPLAGLDYTHAVIQPYTETGDSLITMAVDRQALDHLTGDAGLQVRFPFLLGGGLYSPFINVTAEHDFIGTSRTVTTTQVTAPLIPVLTSVPNNGRAYGKVAAGIAVTVAGNLSATVNMATTFARAGGNDFTLSGGIKLSF